MTSIGVGATLRHERLQKQLSIEDVARQTRISHRFLRAIEADDFAALPGVVFARNFVRQYAALLGLDPLPLLSRLPVYNLQSAPMPAAPLPSSDRAGWDPRWNSAIASVAWVVLACGAAVAAYLYFNRVPPPHPQRAVAAPAAVPIPAPAPPSRTTAPAEIPAAVPVPSVPVPSLPVPSASPLDHPTADTHPVRVVVTARDDAWVQVTAEGKTAFIGVLKAGESRNFDSDTPVRVRTGNAGGIDISLNGSKIEPLGPAGQIRSVSLTAEGPRYAPKTPPASSDPA